MFSPILAGDIDVALLIFWAFVLFFICLVFYLRREDRREGYPLEDEITGRVDSAQGPLSTSLAKTFELPFDHGTVTTPTQFREPVDVPGRRIDRFAGAPYTPTGNPLVDGIGPAAWADRAPWPDYDQAGRPRIVPIAEDAHIEVSRNDAQLIGWPVIAADGEIAGTISDIWVDRADHVIRYLAVTTPLGREVLAPMAMAVVENGRRQVRIDAISADQYNDAPGLASPVQITRYEEERVLAYFGGGYLYGLRGRTEPIL